MDDEQFVYVIPKPAVVPAGDISQAEWDDLLAAYTDLLTAYNALALDDITDVDTTGVGDGDALVYDLATTTWIPGDPAGGIATVEGGEVEALPGATILNFEAGLNVYDSTDPGRVSVEVDFGGTGSATTVSHSNHTHNAAVNGIDTGVATGVLSSGTRSLVSTTTSTLVSGVVYDIDGQAVVRARNNVDSGTMNLLFRIGADGSYPQRSRNVQTVGGVPVDQIINFVAVLTGTGAGEAVTFSVQFGTGDAVDLRDHEIIVKCHPRR